MAEIDNFLDLAAISGNTEAQTPDVIPNFGPITTPDSIFATPNLPPVLGGQGTPTTPPSVDPKVKMFANILALLLAGGGLAGAGQQLFGSPPTTKVTSKLSPQAAPFLTGAQQQFGQTGSLLQALMGAIQNPQIPSGLSLLAEQAFEPQFGTLYGRAAEAGRRRGFHDAPATSPPGGAILGPGLADLQGQIAAAKLNLYQNNLANMLSAFQGSQSLAQGQGQLAAALPIQQQTQAPKPSILQTLGGLSPIIKDIGSILGAVNPPPPNQIPQQITSFLSGLFGGNQGG